MGRAYPVGDGVGVGVGVGVGAVLAEAIGVGEAVLVDGDELLEVPGVAETAGVGPAEDGAADAAGVDVAPEPGVALGAGASGVVAGAGAEAVAGSAADAPGATGGSGWVACDGPRSSGEPVPA